MMKTMLAAATAAAVMIAVPWFAGSVPARAEGLKMAQAGVDVQIGRDRDEKSVRDRDEKNRRDRDRRDEGAKHDEGGKNLTIGVGPKGIEIGPKERERCKTVTTTVERDGRKETSRERRCD
jgi:hypothetical protein